MGSHSVTCHPTQVNTLRLTSTRQAGSRLTYPRGMEGWVDLGDRYIPRWLNRPLMVNHPSLTPDSAQLGVELAICWLPDHCTTKPPVNNSKWHAVILTGSDTSGTAQVASSHCPNERTLDSSLQPDRPTYAPASHTMAFTLQCSLVTLQWLTIFSSEYYQILIATHLPTPAGMESWVGLSTMSVNNLLMVITRKRSWWDLNPRPLTHKSETLPLRHRATNRPFETKNAS